MKHIFQCCLPLVYKLPDKYVKAAICEGSRSPSTNEAFPAHTELFQASFTAFGVGYNEVGMKDGSMAESYAWGFGLCPWWLTFQGLLFLYQEFIFGNSGV